MKQVVIDASVALKWYLADEDYGYKALNLLTDYVSNKLNFFAPSLLEYEVINGLLIAQKRGRIKEEKFLRAIDGFLNLDIKLTDLSNFYHKTVYYCKKYNCSVYDSSYLATADETRSVLVTADERLYHTVKNDIRWVKWIGDI